MKINLTIDKNIKPDCLTSPIQPIYVTEFNEAGYKKFADEFYQSENRGQSIIPIIIDSYGGEVNSLMGMLSIIKNSKAIIPTVLETKAMSCGAVLFSAGTRGYKYMSPYASIMIHEVSNFSFGKIEEAKASVEYGDKLNQIILEEMDRNCGRPIGWFSKSIGSKKNADWFIFPEEAIKIGLADKIKIPTLEVSISHSFKIT